MKCLFVGMEIVQLSYIVKRQLLFHPLLCKCEVHHCGPSGREHNKGCKLQKKKYKYK